MKDFPHNAGHSMMTKWQQAPGYFRPEVVAMGILTTYDAVIKGVRISTSRQKKHLPKVGDTITISSFGKPSYYAEVTRVYDKTVGELIQENPEYADEWSRKQVWTKQYLIDNPDALDKYDVDFIVTGKVPAINSMF